MLRKIFTIFCLFSVFSCQVQKPVPQKAVDSAPKPKIDYTLIGAPMPEMLLVTLDTVEKKVKNDGNWWSRMRHKNIIVQKSNRFTGSDFDNGANLIIMMFNPTCSHCVEETEILKRNMTLFNKTKMILMANSRMHEYLPDFVKQRKTKEYPVFTVGLDSANFINDVFLYKNLPQINIYNGERKLIKIYNGDVPIDSLKPYIQ